MIDFEKLIKRLHWMTAEKEIEWEDNLLDHSYNSTRMSYRTAVRIDGGNPVDVEITETAYLHRQAEVSMKVASLFYAPDDYRLMILDLLDCIDSVGTDTFESDAMEIESRINQWLGDFEEE